MSTNLTRLKNIIEQTDLLPDEQQALINLFTLAEDDYLIEIVKIIEKNPEWVKQLYDNYQRKKQALANQDKQAWQRIVDGETRELETLKKDQSYS